MKSLKSSLLLLLIMFTTNINAQDWANFSKYSNQNNEVKKSGKRYPVVFMGNSITENWVKVTPGFFNNNNYLGRGISGQTTSQMLVRFRADVIDLQPKVVVILAGTNDIAENNGSISLKNICSNIISMCDLAKANGIKVILCSVLPAAEYPWRPGKNPKEKIPLLNELIKDYAAKEEISYVDFYSAMVDENMGLNKAYANDGVHPTLNGYKVMMPMVKEAIGKVL